MTDPANASLAVLIPLLNFEQLSAFRDFLKDCIGRHDHLSSPQHFLALDKLAPPNFFDPRRN